MEGKMGTRRCVVGLALSIMVALATWSVSAQEYNVDETLHAPYPLEEETFGPVLACDDVSSLLDTLWSTKRHSHADAMRALSAQCYAYFAEYDSPPVVAAVRLVHNYTAPVDLEVGYGVVLASVKIEVLRFTCDKVLYVADGYLIDEHFLDEATDVTPLAVTSLATFCPGIVEPATQVAEAKSPE